MSESNQEGRTLARSYLFKCIEAELTRAYKKHGAPLWGRHEFYAILKEEVDELWDDIKADKNLDYIFSEAIQVAAMVIRYLETGDRYQGSFSFAKLTEVLCVDCQHTWSAHHIGGCKVIGCRCTEEGEVDE